MLILSNRYPGRANAPTAAFPAGSVKNVTVVGDDTGTPADELWFNDVYGALQAVLDAAGVSPDDVQESATASQFVSSLDTLYGRQVDTDKLIRHYMRRASALNVSLARASAAGVSRAVAGSATTPNAILGGDGGVIHVRNPDTGQWTLATSGTTTDIVDADYDDVGERYVVIGNLAGVPSSVVGTSFGTSWAAGISGTANLPDVVSGVAFAKGYAGARRWLVVGDDGAGNGEYAELLTDGSGSSLFAPAGASGFELYGAGNEGDASGTMLVVGENGHVALMTMQGPYNVQTSGVTEDLRDAAWSDFYQSWIAVGDNGTIITSADGITWATQTSPVAAADWKSVDAAGEAVVIVGSVTSGAELIVAGDMTSWVRTASPVFADPTRVRFVGGRQYLYASGDDGDCYESQQA